MDDILNAWKGAGWSALLARIDGEIASMEARASEAETGKKTLLAASGEYRKGTTKEQRAVAVPLIKTFQKEVDECTSRSRQVETVLVDLCQQLAALPDPLPVFEQCSVWQRSAQRASEEADELRDNIQQLTHEFSHLQNQDVTLRLLKEKIKELECEKTSEVAQSATDTELALRKEFSIREQEMSLRGDKLRAENASLEKKVSELEQRVRDAHRQLDSARLAADQREALEAEQSDIVQRDLDRANRRIASLESEMDRLAAQLVEAQRQETRPPRTGLEDIAALGGLMKERDAQIQKLTDENRRLSERLAKAAAATESKLSTLQQQLNEKTLRVMECEAVLSRQHDYDAIKNELRLLRSMEFGSETSGIDGEMTVGEAVKTIDQLMADKNRRLDRDNAQLRLASEQLQARLASAESELSAQTKEGERMRALIGQLETDLERVGGKPALPHSHTELSTLELLAESVEPSDPVPGDPQQSMLSVVTAQRDRLKEKLKENTEELMSEKQRHAVTLSEMEKMRDDNVKLIGKIKFLQSYGKGDAPATAVQLENKYDEQYERRLDPFTRFTHNERHRVYTRLGVHERATLSIGRAIMTSSSARLTFLFYLLALHCMVFLVLYRYAYAEACHHDFDADCAAKFAQHMQQQHKH